MFKTNRIINPYILIPWTFTICSLTIILWSLRNKRHQKSQGNTNILNLKEHNSFKNFTWKNYSITRTFMFYDFCSQNDKTKCPKGKSEFSNHGRFLTLML